MMFPLNHGVMAAQTAGWSPLELVDGSNGDAYDMLDMSRAYQDVAGTTPVTQSGDLFRRTNGLAGGMPLVDDSGGTNAAWTPEGAVAALFNPETASVLGQAISGYVIGVSFIDSPELSGSSLNIDFVKGAGTAYRLVRRSASNNLSVSHRSGILFSADTSAEWVDGDGGVNSVIIVSSSSDPGAASIYLNGVLYPQTANAGSATDFPWVSFLSIYNSGGVEQRNIRRGFVMSGDITESDIANLDSWLRGTPT